MTAFVGRAGVATYRAIVIKQSIAFYAKTGMKVNRAYTPAAMLMAAESITGKSYKRGQYALAIADLEAWIAAYGTTGTDSAA
jgi:hypothetical protein